MRAATLLVDSQSRSSRSVSFGSDLLIETSQTQSGRIRQFKFVLANNAAIDVKAITHRHL